MKAGIPVERAIPHKIIQLHIILDTLRSANY